ncbi:NAD(P)/FAD-dependent oxidoreductase [Nocardioides sp. cx-169]|uniref:flavin-containing monooxygenase n=1 Tax=Nocardioides sp. cx-169 TaxID=2899080 RepID=UPI001E2D8743|nr:NAD(P)/FAD-dependent oxidoreductase [Nocardioides sp. cx-169]MCD4536275.1 NAD(P)/FAD-dependent oxidoreductase [Nocardioides sp. cx-169]
MSSPHAVDHVIIGSGFAGLCAAIKLQEDGETDFVVLEKAGEVGGTWRDNTYPGAACDVPSQLYSYSFAEHDWPSSYSPQPDIQAYIQRVAAESGTLDRFAFDTPVTDAVWDASAQRWSVHTPAGVWTARFLVVAAGALEEPKVPDLPGLDTFQGHVFHSARWDHDVDLAGKRIAVIGTGASAIQIIPELQKALQPTGGHLDVYQRSAPWVIPRNDRAYSRLERLALRRVPGLRRLYRTGLYWSHEAYVPAFTLQPKIAAPARALALRNIEKGISDPVLRDKVTPRFAFGCKRVLRSNTYYPALAADNTEVITERISKVTGNAVVTEDGTEREVDVLVVATGFHTTDLPIAEHITGRSGRTLADTWRSAGMAAYKGTTVPGFPNLFMLVGPNTGQGHTSMIFIIESQVAYLRDALRTVRRRGLDAVEPTQEATDRWNRSLQRRMRHTVWTTGGCDSWYLDDHGRNTVLWPRTTADFRRRLASFDEEAYA